MTSEERATLHALLESLMPSRIYGLVRSRVDIELLHPAGSLPVPMGTIDSDGRLSIDALAAHVPSKLAHLYASDLAELLGCRTAGWRDMVLVDADGNRPMITPLLEDGGAVWAEVLTEHGARIHRHLQQKAAGQAADGFLLDE